MFKVRVPAGLAGMTTIGPADPQDATPIAGAALLAD